MVKCPKCNAEIDELYMTTEGSLYKSTTTLNWEVDDINEEPNMWRCPECGEEIVEEDEVDKFLYPLDEDE